MRSQLVIALVSLSFTTAAYAEEGEDDGPTVEISGFVDTSLTYGFTPKALADEGLLLGLDQVELDFDVSVGEGLELRVDLNFYPQEELAIEDGGLSAFIFEDLLEQGYARWQICGGDFFLRAGKWNAPIGFEVTDPTGLWQFSQGLLFTFATPVNLTGFALGWEGETTQVQLWLTNDWDQAATAKQASIGGRFQQGLGDAGTVGLSATYGTFVEDDAKLMLDLDLALAFDKLKIGAEFNFGMEGDFNSIGALLALNYGFSDTVGATLRFDYLDREIPDSAYKGMSITGAGLFNLHEGFDLIAEIRADLPDGGDTAVGGALELLASF